MVSPIPGSADGLLTRAIGEVPRDRSILDALREAAERGRAERQPETAAPARPAPVPGPERKGLEFVPLPELNLVQVRVVDRATDEVVREIPPDERIRFVERFRALVRESEGRHLDLRA